MMVARNDGVTLRTRHDHRSGDSPRCTSSGSNIDVQRVHDTFEIEWHLYIENLFEYTYVTNNANKNDKKMRPPHLGAN